MNRFAARLLASLPVVALATVGAIGPASTRSVSAADRTPLDRVVAVVNDEVVLMSQLRKSMASSPLLQEALSQLPDGASTEQREQKLIEVRSKVLDELVDTELIKTEADRFQISAADADIDRYVQNIAANYGVSVEQFRQQVETGDEYGSWAEYREVLRTDILVWKTTQALAVWNVTEAQIREHYRKMSRDEGAKAVVERFLFAPGGDTPRDRDRAFARAQSLARRLRSGSDAAALAQEPGVEGQFGVEIGRGQIAPALEDEVFAAKPGEIVGPLGSGQGYVVFRITEQKASSAVSYEQAKDRIRAQLENEAFIKAQREFKQQLRAKAHVDIRL